jgi:hypothetical protein
LPIHTLYNSLQHALYLFSLLYLHRLSPGNGFQRRSFLSFYVHTLTGRRLSPNQPESESYVTTDGQSASLSWNKAPIWRLRPDFYYCQTVAVLLIWDSLSDERTGLSLTIGAGPRQRTDSRVRVPWDSRSYFTVSDSRLPFSSPPATRRATVEVFDPASTWDT